MLDRATATQKNRKVFFKVGWVTSKNRRHVAPPLNETTLQLS
jgi:hypothetical protein